VMVFKDAVQTGSLSIDVQLVTDAQLQGAQAAYAPAGQGQAQRIYLNADWLNGEPRTDWVAQVLMEEVGQALDVYLNGGIDSLGDEGQRFALAAVAPAEQLESILADRGQDNDVGRLIIDGEAVDVEFAVAPNVSLFFADGYLGTQGNNTNQANNIRTLATLGVTRAAFVQVDVNGDGLFGDGGGTQGNDLSGSLRLYLSNGSILNLSGALNWRETTGSRVEVFGFIFDPGQTASISFGSGQTFNIVGGSTSSTSTTMGLKAFSSAFTFSDGTNRSGNAATSGLLDDLNNYLRNSPRPNNITLTAGSVLEGQNLVYSVTMSAAPTVTMTYAFGVTGTATSAVDYGTSYVFSNGVTNNGDGTINVPVGVTSFTVTIPTLVDAVDDANETVILTVGGQSATGFIAEPLKVTSLVVNEASPFAVFEITGGANQAVTLALASGTTNTASGAGVDYGTAVAANNLEISANGTTWTLYNNAALLNASGSLKVRTAIVNDAISDNNETFRLVVSPISAAAAALPIYDVAYRPISLSLLTRISGTDGAAGAVYRQTNGITIDGQAIDIRVQIVARSNVSDYTNDDNSSNTTRFQPQINSSSSSGSSVDYLFTFFKSGTTEQVALKNFVINPVDVDGISSTNKEFVELSNISSYQLGSGSLITVKEGSTQGVRDGFLRFEGRSDSLTGITFDNTASFIAYYADPVEQVGVRLGVSGSSTSTRLFSMAIGEALGTFTNPTSTNSTGTVIGTATIKDDGTGVVFDANGNTTTNTPNDDRALTVNSFNVNEASPFAVFEVRGAANQLTSLALAMGITAPVASGAGVDYGTATGSGLEIWTGSAWSAYTSGFVALNGSGVLLVRTAIVNDAVADNNETFRLSASNTGGTAALGVATIKDDGTGTIFKSDGTDDTAVVRDDDRGLTVNSITVNEASPYAVFEVTGAANQLAKLALDVGSSPVATGGGVDYANNTATVLQYLVGSTWTNYTANSNVSLGVNGKLFVRTLIVNDTLADNGETFKLNAINTGTLTAFGVATIKDDGTGDIFKDDTTKDLTARKDDDRALTVNNITVNEASPYAVFEVRGAANQLTSLALAAGTSTPASGAGVDYGTATGSGLEVWTGSAWSAYTSGFVSLNGSGVLLVRTPIINDSPVDNNETFQLNATNSGGVVATGVATIKDDGTGNVYSPDGTVNQSASKDNDAFVALPTVNNVMVNEASPYAVLQVSGQLGQMVTLSLETGTATAAADYTASMEFSTDGGGTWTAYSSAVALNGAGGTLLVRVPVLQDTPNEPEETFVLKVTTTANTFAAGTVTIVDDGNGVIFNANGTENTTTVKDDDRVITITSPEVNEGSPSAFFVLTGAPGQNGFIYDGAILIHSFTFGDTGSYGFFYSYTAEQETAVDGPEAKTLTVKTQSNTTSTGTATIKDDGTGSYWVAGNATPLTSAQLIAADVALDDDRVLAVNDIAVNEASPYAVFTVTGVAGQRVSLALAVGSSSPATAGGIDYSQNDGAVLQYFDGANWVDYTPGTAGPAAGTGKYAGTVALDATGSLLVRTRIVNDAVSDNNETFKLNVTNTGGVTRDGVATIKDDGTGTIFKSDGTNDSAALPDDDRALTVTGTTVNEASSHVVFSVTGLDGQKVQLSLTASGSGNGHALVGTDTGLASQLEYLDGTTWKSYTGGYLTLPTEGGPSASMLVRVAVKNDALNEGSETLKLIASTTGVSTEGLSTIRDDGLGNTVTFNGGTGAPTYSSGPGAAFDDDRTLTVGDITVAESVVGGQAVFNVNGFEGQYVKLALIAGTAAQDVDFGSSTLPDLEYSNDNGANWSTYTPNSTIQMAGTPGNLPMVLKVRTAVIRDTSEEPTEQFRLVVTNTGGTEGRGTASITDNAKPALSADTAMAVEQSGFANGTAGVNPGGNLVAGTLVNGNLGVGGADSDADGDTLTVASVANTAVSATAVATPSASAVNVQGLYGVLSVNNAGAYTYTVTNTNADVQALRSAADTLTETFTYKVTDGWGGESTSTLTVTIRGANDAPVAVADFGVAKESLAGSIVGAVDYRNVTAYSTSSGATYDALGYKATGSVLPNDTDVDGNDTQTVLDAKPNSASSVTSVTSGGVTLTGVHGSLLIRADGTYTYTPTVNSTLLSEGQSADDVFVYTLRDAAGLTSTANLTITVFGSGTNDPDAVDDANTVAEAGGSTSAVVATGNVLGASGVSAGDKADTTPTNTSPLAVSDARSTSVSTLTPVTSSTVINGQYGVLTLSSTGEYSYALTNTLSGVQELQVGQTLSESFIYQVKNGPFGDPAQRRVDSATLTITITGTNDTPTLDLDTTAPGSANFATTFTEGGQAVSLSTAAGVNLADVDSTSFANVTVTIAEAQVLDGISEALLVRGATAGGTLTLGDFTAASGSVTLGGLAYSYERSATSSNLTFVFKGPSGAVLTTAQAESLLDALSYQNTSDNPTVSGTRVFSLSVTDSGSLTSNTATSTITVVAVNDAPVLDLDANDSSSATGANYRVNYSIGGAAVAVADTDRLVSDVDDTHMESATLVLTNAQANDVLTAGTMPSGITASVAALTNGQITVTLTGSAIKSDYEAAIRAITFSTTSANLTSRDVQVLVSDGSLSTNLGTTTIVVSPDDRPVSVTGTNVNEKSPFVLFTVSGAANQKVSLQLASTGSTAGHASLSVDTANANTTFVLQYLSASTWTNYAPGLAVALDNAGNLLVRTGVENDAVSEGVESLQLIARNGAGTANASPGLSTIRDDGQGGYFEDGNTTTTSAVPGGVVLDDDRPLAVNNVTVNEASPYAVFEVSGAANQLTRLSLADGVSPLATAGGTDYSNASGTGLQYLVGSSWTDYTANANVSLGATGKLLVRTSIVNDGTLDTNETFKLTATNTGNSVVSGLSTIKDDGTGDVFGNNGLVNLSAIKDDDRAISVNDVTVNEGSSHVVFEVSGFAGQLTSLELMAGTAPLATAGGVDFSSVSGSGLQYRSGANWLAYSAGSFVALDGTGKLLVRTAIANDAIADNNETFKLRVAATGGLSDVGTVTIKDDGTGTVFGSGGSVDEQAIKDDDRPVTVTSPMVNEASPFAVFTVGGASNQWVSLDLSSTGTTAGHATAGTDYTALVQTSVNGGLTWTTYTDGVNLNSSGSLLVRIPVLQDSVNEVDETFKLTVGNAGGGTVVGTATIQDDGNGTLYNPDGTVDTTTPKDDDRGFGVSSPTVNEASPFAVFTIDGTANQVLTGLSLQGGTATSLDFGDSLEISSDNGSTWISYTGGNFTLNGAGQLLVRTPIKPDAFVDNNETFTLTVSSSARSSVGTATIKDDGTGTVYRQDNGQPDPAAPKDNDAPRVTGTTVNEASPFVMWTVHDVVEGQAIKLSLLNTAVSTDNDAELVLGNDPADVGSTLQYWNGSVWTNYQPGQNGGFVTVPSDGDSTAGEPAALKVRLAVINDVGLPVFEGPETLVLKAEVATGQNGLGTSTIVDDGTGSRFDFDGLGDSDPTETTGPGTGFDDDRSLIVYDTMVNEGSPYAVFRVAAVPGMRLILELSNGSATGKVGAGAHVLDGSQDFGPNMQYFDGLSWVNYTPNSVYVVPAGSRITLVRTPVVNDTLFEDREDFVLTVRTEAGDISDAGTGAIVDDGTSVIFNESGAEDRFAVKNDDRTLKVNSIEVNEGSDFAVFTVNGTAGTSVTLQLRSTESTTDVNAILQGDGRDTRDASSGFAMQYSLDGGQSWLNYSSAFSIPSSGQVFVRTGINNDPLKEGAETFNLVVTTVANSFQAVGLATIFDDGSGKKFPGTITVGQPDNNTLDLDDDFDKDGVAPTVEEILATMAASVGWNTAGLGDLNGDGFQDAQQNALATLAWTTVDKYQEAMNGTLTSIRPIISLAVMPDASGAVVSTTAQLENIKVLAPTDANVGGSKPTTLNGLKVIAPWDPIQFSIAKQSGTADFNVMDVNSLRSGLQVRVLIDVSASLMPADSFNAYLKYVSAEAFAVLPLGSVDNAGTPITGAGWYDFTQRVPGGDGARFITRNGLLTAIELTITDNAFGDNNLTVGMITDPGLPVLINEPAPASSNLTVSSITVNEASPYAVFTIRGEPSQVLRLTLNQGEALVPDFGPGLEVFSGVVWETYSGQLLQLDPDGRLLVRTPIANDGIYEGAETFSLTATPLTGSAASGVATIKDDGTGDVFRPGGSVDVLASKDDDRRFALATPPERWMPATGEFEFWNRRYLDQSERSDQHKPLRFDSALFPLLHLDSVKDLGLTEPIASDASQRLTSYEWLKPASLVSATGDSSELRLAARLMVLAGMSDLVVSPNETIKLDVPLNAYSVRPTDVPVKLNARLADGSALPDWIKFDPRSGRFEVSAPEFFDHAVALQLIASIEDGQSAVVDFKIKVRTQQDQAHPVLPGRQGLTEKLKLAAGEKLSNHRLVAKASL
jgi:VCBS repeat-containing protein